ncbi:acyl-CoA--sterol O-acyltransferase 1-like [Primulina eburnea]|uniref:acyl-CoA--sterol O-acyltransferase 1-like n=1 Tax=Primulina eburnea TaxID=1245227 RepID=UPI003C6C826F
MKGNNMQEINNLLNVWSSVSLSVCYCYAVAKMVPKGILRFFMYLPVFCIFLFLPLSLNSVNFTCTTAFSVTWLATFKLLQLVFGNGPLSDASLPLSHFVLISCFPIKILRQKSSLNSPPNKEETPRKKTQDKENLKGYNDPPSITKIYNNLGLRSPLHYAKKGLFFIFLVTFVAPYKNNLPRNIALFLICIYIYIGLEVFLGITANICQILLGVKLESPFNEPYLSTSLQDFWGHRWNRVSSSALRSTVFNPIFRKLWSAGYKKGAIIVAMLATFLVSSLMHDLVFYYLGDVKPAWGTTLFFLMHGIFCLVENILKREFGLKWEPPQLIIGPLIFVFALGTFMWLVLPELIQHKVDDRAIEEYAAVGAFVRDLGLGWSQMGYNFLVQILKLDTKI